MAASRTRKKAQQKKKTEQRVHEENARRTAFRAAFASFSNKVQVCTTCNGERVEVCLEEVEASQREGVEKMLVEMAEGGVAADQLVYCKACNAYSAFSGPMAL
jgi:hypothetical protein